MAILLEISDFQQRRAMLVPCTNNSDFQGVFTKTPSSINLINYEEMTPR